MGRAFWRRSARPCIFGGCVGSSALNCRTGPTATCTTSDFPGAMSLAKSKSRFGGLECSQAGVASSGGCRPSSFRKHGSLAIMALRLDNLRQHSDVLRLRTGKTLMVRFVEPADADALQGYFRALSVHSRYNRFLGALSELPPTELAHFIHAGERDRFSVMAVMVIDGVETIVGEARYGF